MRLSDLEFRFGDSVYHSAGSQPILFSKLTASTWFGHYLLLREQISFVAKPSVIDTQYSQNCSGFDFAIPRALQVTPFRFLSVGARFPYGFYDYENFLLSFLQFKGVGPHIKGRIRDFVMIIYKRIGWELDPPDETKKYFLESESGGFGIIEITLSLGEGLASE